VGAEFGRQAPAGAWDFQSPPWVATVQSVRGFEMSALGHWCAARCCLLKCEVTGAKLSPGSVELAEARRFRFVVKKFVGRLTGDTRSTAAVDRHYANSGILRIYLMTSQRPLSAIVVTDFFVDLANQKAQEIQPLAARADAWRSEAAGCPLESGGKW
jgi:hypothetical protein